jgi:HNH endonuclease
VSAYVPAQLRQQVRDRFANCCAYCQTAEALTVVTFEVEHIFPRSAGGETVFANLCLACPMCNRCKAERMFAVDPATQQEAPLYRPHVDDWDAHFAWSDDATQIVPATATGRATVAALRMNRPALVRLRRMWTASGEHPPKIH